MAKKSTPAKAAEFKFEDINDDTTLALYANGETGAMIPMDHVGPLKHFGYIEVNESVKDASGNVAARMTPEGRKMVEENYDGLDNLAPGGAGDTGASTTQAMPATTAENKSNFVIDADVPMPTSRRGYSSVPSKYPFASLEVGHSFHIPKTEAEPKPAARFASTVTSANKRYASAGKRFITRQVGPDDPRGEGARIFREK